ncbi:DNA repair protein RecN [Psychrosphaera sp. B3R10]|uniref:DNA repair protein RecN n=1 Tax=unclassified Psychrosphaera TaxID=2641570 RepID=UPI001C08549E|nr:MULTISPECIES: DNA repair protein RecN [unclassified Psychrosphaera]MBU2884133.1 DNA repair protein RecN [Psychrosphaera sp. I2R16]MBU2989621.1 DNA repair protein RecN [Psychrosphaera sp. B3R10]MDO6719330.1 DNA repair protein RecN [Psychrosphaera sp. 1_MG-2023]
MLVSLAIKNFAIVKDLEVQWHSAMTTITGETGAGKSIAIDALAQTLGERSDANMVRADEDKAEVIACFDIANLPAAQTWLEQHDLQADNECILRRVISKEGRSRGYINGSQVPASSLKSIGNLLVSIHGQHAHQQLTKPDHQRILLDEYAANTSLLTDVKAAYKNWLSVVQEFKQLKEQQDEFSAQQQLLQYQVNELADAEVQEGEFEQIEAEHKRLHHAQSLLADSQGALSCLYEGDSGNAYSATQQALSLLHKSIVLDENLSATVELVESALIQLDEGASELRRYLDQLELNPERLFEIEQRIETYMDLARKHNVSPHNLSVKEQELKDELTQLSVSGDRLEELELEIQVAEQTYSKLAADLTKVRTDYAAQLDQLISDSMASLNMPGAQFSIAISGLTTGPSASGNDRIEFMVTTNPGQPLQPLAKVASGGELSRISLAIQVIIAKRVTTPTLLFDEVDVGVSGPTASAVGKLMRKLADNTQVICVTHLPQVACFGHQQQFVQKTSSDNQTHTSMQSLTPKGRIDELARLLGGEQISKNTRANAKELLNVAQVA